MSNFSSKYPAFAALLGLLGGSVAKMVSTSGSIVTKIEGEASLLPQLISFVPQASLLASELAVLKQNPADIEAAAELLVSDLAFSSSKAQVIVAAAFPVAESIANLVSPIESLVAAIEA